MEKVGLGSTGFRIHPLVFGTLPLGPLQAGLPVEEGSALIRHALERGVRLIDTAELYRTYPYIREALRGYGGEFHLASKTHASDAQTARRHVENALREIDVKHLDIVLLHGARLTDPFDERGAVFEELLRMRDEGKIGHVGISTHSISAARKAATHPDVNVLHPLINHTGMGILDGGAVEMADVIADAAKEGKWIYAMKALAGGNLIRDARASFRYVLDLPGVHAVAVGMLSTKEIDANLALFSGKTPEEKVWRELESRRRRITVMAFCKGCGDCVPACTNEALWVSEGKARVKKENCILCGYCAAACPDFAIRVV